MVFNFGQVGEFLPVQMLGLAVGVYPAACLMCALCPFLGGGDYSGQFSAEVNNEWHYTSAATICLHVLYNFYTVAYRSIQHFSGTVFYFHTSVVRLFAVGNMCLVY